MTGSAIVNLNGQLLPPNEARVSVYDRGYLYGDSLYEVVRTYRGIFYRLDDHLRRLERSAELCHMALDQSLENYRREIERTFGEWRARPENGKLEAYCRLIVSRGEGRIGFGLPCLTTSTLYTIIIQPVESPSEDQFRRGYKVKITERLRNDPRALDPAMKSGNYLNSLLAYLEATADGYDDALLCNVEGHLAEGTTFNIFYVRRGILATPPLDIGILDGITRRQVIDLARELGYRAREVRFPRERLYEADEVFLSSSIKEAFPITNIDGRRIANGRPGPITIAIRDELRKRIEGNA